MDLKAELDKRSTLFTTYWRRYLIEKKPVQLYKAANHLPQSGGKHLRPCIALLSCESVQGSYEHVLPFASALELMHNFTLVHDDIMDKSTLRRNKPAVHMKYGEPTAILSGDLLFSKVFEAMQDLSLDGSVFKVLHRKLIHCVQEICEGQQLDMEFQQQDNITEEEYLEMIHKKTAVLFQLAAQGGAILGSATSEQLQGLTSYGTSLGLAFQIWDDYLDISSSETVLGKDIGNDIRNGKKTLIAVHAHSQAKDSDKKTLSAHFGNQNASEEDVQTILSLFNTLGSVDYAKQTAFTYSNNAIQALDSLPKSEAKDILCHLAKYAVQREK